MGKGKLKEILTQRGVSVVPTYRVVLDKDGNERRVSPSDKQDGTMHYRAEPKKKTFNI